METATFNIPSISCSACSKKIQDELSNTYGIENVNVDLKTQNVKVDYQPQNTTPQDIKSKISAMGYEVI